MLSLRSFIRTIFSPSWFVFARYRIILASIRQVIYHCRLLLNSSPQCIGTNFIRTKIYSFHLFSVVFPISTVQCSQACVQEVVREHKKKLRCTASRFLCFPSASLNSYTAIGPQDRILKQVAQSKITPCIESHTTFTKNKITFPYSDKS